MFSLSYYIIFRLFIGDVGIPSGHPTIGVPDAAQPKAHLEAQVKSKKPLKITYSTSHVNPTWLHV